LASYLSPEGKEVFVKALLNHLLESGTAKKVHIKESLKKLEGLVKEAEAKDELVRWMERVREAKESLMTVVCRVVEPHHIDPKRVFAQETLKVTQEHLTLLTGK
jgi:hypothetical protein